MSKCTANRHCYSYSGSRHTNYSFGFLLLFSLNNICQYLMVEDKLQVATVPLLGIYPLMHDLLMVGYFWLNLTKMKSNSRYFHWFLFAPQLNEG